MDVLGAAEDWLRVWPFLLLGLLKVVAESRLEVAVPELMEQVAGYYREGADFSITWFAFLKSVVTGKRGERDNRLKKR